MKSLFDLPALAIEIDGQALAAANLAALEEARVVQALSLPAQCELTFRNPEAGFVEAAIGSHGQSLSVRTPSSGGMLFQGEVTGAEASYGPAHANVLRLRGYDLLHRLRKRQPARVHVETTAAELASELASSAGLTAVAGGDGPLRKRILQYRQSDYDLLLEALEDCGLYATVRGANLHILSLAGGGDPIPLRLGEELLEVHVTVSGEPACRAVEAAGWNTCRAEAHTGRAATSRVGRTASAAAPPTRFSTDGQRRLTGQLADDDRQAEALAQAELDRRTAREVSLRGLAEGNAALVPGARIAVSGVSNSLAGNYVLASVTHRIERTRGFTSEISTEPPQPLPRHPAASMALGMVTRVNDPEGMGRVRASLPAYGNLETDWMNVVSPGAGAGKGFALLPDVGDQVLILFARDSASHGVVLGGLYGAAHSPEPTVESGAVMRYALRTHGGQRLTFDDHAKSLRMEDAAGNCVEFSPDRLLLHSSVPIEIEAIHQPVTIRGKQIHFEEA